MQVQLTHTHTGHLDIMSQAELQCALAAARCKHGAHAWPAGLNAVPTLPAQAAPGHVRKTRCRSNKAHAQTTQYTSCNEQTTKVQAATSLQHQWGGCLHKQYKQAALVTSHVRCESHAQPTRISTEPAQWFCNCHYCMLPECCRAHVGNVHASYTVVTERTLQDNTVVCGCTCFYKQTWLK